MEDEGYAGTRQIKREFHKNYVKFYEWFEKTRPQVSVNHFHTGGVNLKNRGN